MLNDLPFYEIDEEWLGSESEEYEAEDKDRSQVIINSQKKDEDEDEDSPMVQALKMQSREGRMEDMRAVADKEMSINEYQVQPATNQCMTDFFLHDHMGPDDIEAHVAGDVNHGVPAEELPLNYYDNDDGFWDDYIQQKHEQWDKQGLLTNRKFFVH